MSKYLSISTEQLKEKLAYWTAKEIEQQPAMWAQTAKIVSDNRPQLDAFLSPIMAKQNLRIIFTGAGTSAYIGDAIVPHLRQETNLNIASISTTDIVGTPESSLKADVPTLLVSFGRSGSSPESVAAVNIADSIVKDCYHLIVTCNADGHLAKASENKTNAFTLLMPEPTLDQSFAMTSSFTSMLVAALTVFTPSKIALEQAITCASKIISDGKTSLKALANSDANRIVFLGAGSLTAIAREAALKCLELTAGKNISYFETPLGFRHGPKSLVNNQTTIIMFPSLAKYTKAYDDDLLQEITTDNIAENILSIDLAEYGLQGNMPDVWAGLPYIIVAQIFSFYQSLKFDLSPDNPCPTGEVNRVVQGVTIHEL